MTFQRHINLADKFGDSEFSNYEVLSIGEAVLNWVNAVGDLGHESPASTLDYTNTGQIGISGLIVRDFAAWTSGRTETAPGCEARLLELMTNGRWGQHVAERINRQLALLFAEADTG